jgi:hypothetical protein
MTRRARASQPREEELERLVLIPRGPGQRVDDGRLLDVAVQVATLKDRILNRFFT